MLLLFAFVSATQSGGPSVHRPDTAPLFDQERTICAITRTSFSLQYATSKPFETKVEVRQGDGFDVLSHGAAPSYRVVSGSILGLWHSIDVTGLKPGKRYLYRVYDPGAVPTATESQWGAAAPWSREYAVSTEAPAGRKTIIHLPVKVLLMPNVVNAESAVQPDGSIAPEPPKITPEQLSLIENEFKVASRVFWCNSGMRLWVDFKFLVDDRWQRWGPPSQTASPFFQNLPLCRSYGGKDYVDPGGGTFSIVDPRDPAKVSNTPVNDGYACQVEMAWPRRWDPVLRKWSFYVSGGGTYGVDDLPKGTPARSQFLAGGDTAWLAEHEFHHQLESLGEFCLGNSEDDRIVFNHPSPRHKARRGDGTYDEQDWSTAGPHGNQWDVMRYWDRQVTDCQWLRMGFGTTETVVDKDGDGFPDNDPRLPLDAKRFKAFSGLLSYAGAISWDWVLLPLQPSWVKDRAGLMGDPPTFPVTRGGPTGTRPSPTAAWATMRLPTGWFPRNGEFSDDGTGPGDILLPFRGGPDADATRWTAIPASGLLNRATISATYKQGYDEAGYYGLITAKGNVGHIDIDLDGEGNGMFTPPGALGFSIVSLKPSAGQAGPNSLPVSVRPTFGGVQNRTPWLTWKAVRKDDGTLVFEFKIANGGDSPWYWHGAGHKIGVAINAYDSDGRGYSMGEPYRLYYSRMAESRGREPRPATPAALSEDTLTLKPGDKAFTLSPGWSLSEDGRYHHDGDAGAIVIGGQKAGEFDLIAEVQSTGKFGVGAYAAQTPRPAADRDYTAILERSTSTLYVNGQASDSQSISYPPDTHKIELRRRNGGVWLLVDDQVKGYALDKNPRVVLNRFAILAGAGSNVVVRSVGYREAPTS